ncbi:MAG: hypothetical protein OXC40_04620 [Proteobacteria bacterium]|nr:hypothetical protein [Pseudomonadota bacterium]
MKQIKPIFFDSYKVKKEDLGRPAKKRDTSKEQACILVASDRRKNSRIQDKLAA